MKNTILFIAVAATISIQASAEYIIKYNVEPTPNSIVIKGWFDTSAFISEWLNNGLPFDCGVFSPLENTITIGQSFEQSRNCSINQERTIQNRKISETGTYKNEGDPVIETRVSIFIENNDAIGTLENWISISPEYSEWINEGSIYGCTNWSPLANTITNGSQFTQSATDCKQDQTRTRQDKEQELTTNQIRNLGNLIVENNTLNNIANTKQSIGTKANKICVHGYGVGYWYEWLGETQILLNFLSPSILSAPNLIKTSNTSYIYKTPEKDWLLTKGDFVYEFYGSEYKICYE